MTTFDLANRIKLNPRAVILAGRIEFREKRSGGGDSKIPALVPHYAEQGCPVVQYAGTSAVSVPSAAEIEFTLVESSNFPVPALLRTFPKQKNLVMLIYGADGQSPTPAAYRVLREAATLINNLGQGREAMAVLLPITTPAAYGVNNGRYCLLGLFTSAGEAIWLNPDAVDSKMFQGVPYPPAQLERAASNAPAQAAASVWYDAMAAALAGTGLKGAELRHSILHARAKQLLDQGVVSSLEAGLAIATEEAPTVNTEAKTPTPAVPTTADNKAAKSERQKIGAKARGRAHAGR